MKISSLIQCHYRNNKFRNNEKTSENKTEKQIVREILYRLQKKLES